MSKLVQTCVLCTQVKFVQDFDLNESRKGRLKTCQACTAAIEALPRVTADGYLCKNCACYKSVDQYNPPTGRLVCTTCKYGSNFGTVGTPSTVALSARAGVLPVATTTPAEDAGLRFVLAQIGELTLSLETKAGELAHWQQTAESNSVQVDVLRDINAKLNEQQTELHEEVEHLHERINDLKQKLLKAESRALMAEAALAGAAKVVGPAVPEGVSAEDAPALLEKLDSLNVHVREAAFSAIGEALAQKPRPVSILIEWIDDALEKMRFAVKDPQNQAEVLKLIFQIHCAPRTRGEVVQRDRYALGPKAYKARKAKFRVFYTVDDVGCVNIKEIQTRADAYTHGTVASRKNATFR